MREAFKTLLDGWRRARDPTFVPEYEYVTPAKSSATSTASVCMSYQQVPRFRFTDSARTDNITD